MEKRKSGLIVMGDHMTRDEEKKLNCGICGAAFRMDQLAVYDRHVANCAHSDRAQDMEAQSIRRRIPMFQPGAHGDTEREQWFRENREAILEGRIKP